MTKEINHIATRISQPMIHVDTGNGVGLSPHNYIYRAWIWLFGCEVPVLQLHMYHPIQSCLNNMHCGGLACICLCFTKSNPHIAWAQTENIFNLFFPTLNVEIPLLCVQTHAHVRTCVKINLQMERSSCVIQWNIISVNCSPLPISLSFFLLKWLPHAT